MLRIYHFKGYEIGSSVKKKVEKEVFVILVNQYFYQIWLKKKNPLIFFFFNHMCQHLSLLHDDKQRRMCFAHLITLRTSMGKKI